jgi:hypothetical protein
MDSIASPTVKRVEGEGFRCTLWLVALQRESNVLKLWDGTRKINN